LTQNLMNHCTQQALTLSWSKQKKVHSSHFLRILVVDCLLPRDNNSFMIKEETKDMRMIK
jgi:hypothetical protein